MSLTNPNKVVTEERLSEFYGQIRPYLGGMPEFIDNMFSRSEIYSTTEKIIGQWIDGRPLYQRVVQKTFSSIQTGDWNTIVDLGTNCHIVFCDGYMKESASDNKRFPVTYCVALNNYSLVAYEEAQAGRIAVLTPVTAWKYFELLVKYVKTTDTAQAIGVDTDYSTTEKIVGTWIDNKPLYQKTIIATNIGSVSQSTMTEIPFDTTGINECFVAAQNYIEGGANYPDYGTIAAVSNNKIYIKWLHNGSIDDAHITLRYTKN